jgi:hypothetical protein
MGDSVLFFQKLNLAELRQKNKLLGIKNYSRCNKSQLVKNVVTFLSARTIQRWFRKKISFSETCAISLCKVRYPCWAFRVQKGWFHYNLPDLVDYFLVSGDFREPQSKREITIKELENLDDFVKKIGIHKSSLTFAKKNTNHYQQLKNNENYRDAIVEEIRDIICLIRDRLDSQESGVELSFNLEIIYFPAIRNYMKELHRHSKKFLQMTLNGALSVIENIKLDPNGQKAVIRSNVLKWINKEKLRFFK